MSAASVAMLPITDAEEARAFDLASRTLRVALILAAGHWLFVSVLIGVLRGGAWWIVAGVLAVVGVGGTAALVWYSDTRHQTRLAQFRDPLTGELRIPGGGTPLAWKLRVGPWVYGALGIAALIAFAAAR